MRQLSQATQDIWLSGDYAGANAPIVRVTVQKVFGKQVRVGDQVFFLLRFGQTHKPKELPNLASMTWDRSTETIVNECKLTFFNTSPLPIGQTPDQNGDLDRRGWYTPDRGLGPGATRWGYDTNHWRGYLKPDRIFRVYEGFGFDPDLPPELDPNVYLTGTWLSTDVDFNDKGQIVVSCHDLGRELQDCTAYPPVVPFKRYPVSFTKRTSTTVPGSGALTGTFWSPRYRSDSGLPYVGYNGENYGHRPSHAFDGKNDTYWLSIGNSQPGADFAFEYVEGGTNGRTINAVRGRVWDGPYKVYCSIKTKAGGWEGKHTIPYNPSDPVSAPNGANVRYVATKTVDHEGTVEFHFPTAYTDVVAVRLTFTDLCNSHLGPYPYRAGVREFTVAGDGAPGGDTVKSSGNYNDYTDLVKLFLAYGGFYWPHTDNLTTDVLSDGSTVTTRAPAGNDAALADGDQAKADSWKVARVWGDFEQAGTLGDSPLPVSTWDKKPLADCISYVRDILNFLFTIDYDGGAIWRSPNIWKIGNFISGGTRGTPDYVAGAAGLWTLDERTILVDLTAKLSSASMREGIFIANSNGRYGSKRVGMFGTRNSTGPEPVHFRRVGGWTDTHFQSRKECTIMADLIALRQLFTYRTDRLTIVGYPGIQIDDQARIYERTSNEAWIHYISGVHASWDAKTRRYVYQLDTNWLGDHPYDAWAFNPNALDPDTQAYLRTIGAIT